MPTSEKPDIEQQQYTHTNDVTESVDSDIQNSQAFEDEYDRLEKQVERIKARDEAAIQARINSEVAKAVSNLWS